MTPADMASPPIPELILMQGCHHERCLPADFALPTSATVAQDVSSGSLDACVVFSRMRAFSRQAAASENPWTAATKVEPATHPWKPNSFPQQCISKLTRAMTRAKFVRYSSRRCPSAAELTRRYDSCSTQTHPQSQPEAPSRTQP